MGDFLNSPSAIRVAPLLGKNDCRVTIVEDNRMSNNVPYRFNLLQKGWFASYECRIDRSLLDIPSKRIETEEFEVYDHRWSVSIKHTNEGYLAAYLRSKNTVNVDLIYSIAVIVQSSGKLHSFSSGNRSFSPNDSWGSDRLAPISEIMDPEFGFLDNGSFIVRTDLRFALPGNGIHTCSTGIWSGSYTWELKDLIGRGPLKIVSPEFTAANHQWQLLICPCGEEHGASHAAAFLRCVSDLNASVRAKFKITAFNQHSDRTTVSKETTHVFQQGSSGWGWPDFIEIKSLKDKALGFINDDWTTFTVHIEVLEDNQNYGLRQQGLLLRQPSTAEDPVCIYCLDKKQTAGVLHGNSTHKCVCGDCIKILEQRKLPCPLCMKKVDLYIYEYF